MMLIKQLAECYIQFNTYLFPVGSNTIRWSRAPIVCSFLSKCPNSLACASKSDQDDEGLGSMFGVQLKGDEMSNLKSLEEAVIIPGRGTSDGASHQAGVKWHDVWGAMH